MEYEKNERLVVRVKRLRVAKLGNARTPDDKKLVRLCQCVTRSRVHAPQLIYVKSRMWRYDHVWGVEDRCAISDVAISGHPLAHTGNVPLPAARYRDPDAGVGQLGAGALVRSRRRAGRLSRILMSC